MPAKCFVFNRKIEQGLPVSVAERRGVPVVHLAECGDRAQDLRLVLRAEHGCNVVAAVAGDFAC